MRLKAFCVTNYKSILESGRVELDPNVTCLMGKNESGKSALMQALWKFKNASGTKFDLLWDLPAERYSDLRALDPEVVSLEFALESSDKAAFAEKFGVQLTPPPSFTIRATYAGKRTVEPAFGPPPTSTYADLEPLVRSLQTAIAERLAAAAEAEAAAAAVDGVPTAGESDKDATVGTATKPDASAVAATRAAAAAAAAVKPRLQAVGTSLAALEKVGAPAALATSMPTATIDAAIKALRALEKADIETVDLSAAGKSLETFSRESAELRSRDEASQWLVANLPVFIYFDDYGRLKTRINLRDFVGRQAAPPPDPGDRTLFRTQLALFEWAKLNPMELLNLGQPKQQNEAQDLVERRKAERDRLLESASFKLSGDWLDWWDQRTHELVISADGEDLELRVRDNLNPWKIPFGERSRGFQWFFSFYLTFLVESEKEHLGAIILLDEPGLHLHMTAQLKLLRFFQKIAKKNQLVYSSHSPFMVDPDHVDAVRTVYLDPVDKKNKKSRAYTRISATAEPEGDRDTLLPMQAAGSYQLAQTVFLGKRTLIVEGITDYWLLHVLSNILRENGGTFLHDDTVILWAGGTARLLPLASVISAEEQMGPNRMAVLLDSDKMGLQKAHDLVDMLVHGRDAVLLLGDLLGTPQAQAEDIADPADLLKALEAIGRKPAAAIAPKSGETNVPFLKRVFAENKWGEVTPPDKARLVLAVVDAWRSGDTKPSAEVLRRASLVFTAVNERFARLAEQ